MNNKVMATHERVTTPSTNSNTAATDNNGEVSKDMRSVSINFAIQNIFYKQKSETLDEETSYNYQKLYEHVSSHTSTLGYMYNLWLGHFDIGVSFIVMGNSQ